MKGQIICAAAMISGCIILSAGLIRDHTPDGSEGGPLLFIAGFLLFVMATTIGIIRATDN